MTHSSIYGGAVPVYVHASPALPSDTLFRPNATERQLLSIAARHAEGLPFTELSASFPLDVGRDALRDAALVCLNLKWLDGPFDCLRCTEAGRVFVQAGRPDIKPNGQHIPADAAALGVPANRRDVPADTPNAVRPAVLCPNENSAAPAGKHMRFAEELPSSRIPPAGYDASSAIAAFPEEPDVHLKIKKKLCRVAGTDFGDPPLRMARRNSGRVPDPHRGHIARRLALAWKRRFMPNGFALALKCVFMPSDRDARIVSRHMGELLGALSRPVDLLPIATPVHDWPPVSRAHLHFVASDEIAYRAEARAVRGAAVPSDEMLILRP
jgi:hypothetical protein